MRLSAIIFLLLAQISVFGQKADSVRGAQLYEDGMKIYRSHQYNEAIPIFKNSLKTFTISNPKAYSQTLVRIGIAHSYIPNFDSALFYFRKAEPVARQVAKEDKDYFVIINQQMQLAFTLYQLRKYEEALPVFNETERLIKEDSLNYYLLSYISGSKGRMCVKSGDFDKGSIYLNDAVSYARKAGRNDVLIEALNVNSSYYSDNGDVKKAKTINTEIIELMLEKSEPNDPSMAVAYTLQGRIEMRLEEYERAFNWFNKALNIYAANPDKKIRDHAYALYNFGLAQSRLGNYRKAIDNFDKSLKIYNKIKVGPTFIMPIKSEKAKAYTHLERYEKAKKIYEEIEPLTSSSDVTFILKTEILLSKALYLQKTEQFDSAKSTYLKVIELSSEGYNRTNTSTANAYHGLSKLEYQRENYKSSMEYIEKAILNDQVEINDVKKVNSPNDHIRFLLHKSEILRSSELANLDESFAIIDEAMAFIQERRKESVGSNFSASAIEAVRNKGLEIGFQLFNLSGDVEVMEKAFQYAELSKSQLLSEWLSIASETGISNLSQERILTQKNLATNMKLYRSFIHDEYASSEINQEKIEKYSDSLSSVSEKYYENISQLKNENSWFFQTLYQEITPSILEVNNLLNKDEQIISYNLTQDALFVFIIGEKNHFKRLEIGPDEVEILTTLFRSKISSNIEDDFDEVGKNLYSSLISPIEAELTSKKITIINDGLLNYLPFELLMSADSKFLFEKFLIRYSYSANVFLKETDLKKFSSSGMLAYAPDFSNNSDGIVDAIRSELIKLPGAFKEVNVISDLFNGESHIGENASETSFKKKSKNYELIHLATHAIVDEVFPEKSKLVFDFQTDTIEDGYLHAYEIYNLNLNAQLVTLSACNTGFGKIQKGEGVMSLSRAFAYAGVPATVVSLWPASDKSTPELMKYFYQNLKDGQAKDEALNNARKQYLATAKGKARHPFYWGGFVLIGDNSPIEDDTNLLIWVIPSVLIIVMILTVYRRKKKT